MTATHFAVALLGVTLGPVLLIVALRKRWLWLYAIALFCLTQGFIDAWRYISAAAIAAK